MINYSVSINDGTPLLETPYEPFYETQTLSLVVAINGTRYNAITASWSVNAHGATDTATITIPLSSATDLTVDLFRGDFTPPGASTVVATDNSPVYAEIYAGFTQNVNVGSTDIAQLTRQFVGIVDQYSGKFALDMVTFECRSLGAPLIDDKLVGVSGNQTIAQFIAQMATKYGLPAPVINLVPGVTSKTIQQVLAYDFIGGSNYAAAIRGMSPWDLMLRGAQFDDTDVWVDVTDGTIHYETPGVVKRGAPIQLRYGCDWVSLESTHSPQFSKTVEVRVYTHQPRTRTATAVHVTNDNLGNVTVRSSTKLATSAAILGTDQTLSTSSTTSAIGTTSTSTTASVFSGGDASATGAEGSGESSKQIYREFIANLPAEDAQAVARAIWRKISQHEYAISGKMPMTSRVLANLTIASLLQISGCPWSAVNDKYYPRSLTHTISVSEGWTVDVVAVNHKLAGNAV